MPQFVKMGIGGTGYIGKKESYLRAKRRRLARRKVLPGYPITEPFNSINDIRNYLSGDRIVCLLCGKPYKKIGGSHLKIHGITEDEYRKRYKIPWTYGLCSNKTSENHRRVIKNRIKKGYVPPYKSGKDFVDMVNTKRRKRPMAKETALKNLGEYAKPKYPLLMSPSNSLETVTDRKKRLCSKKGTDEFKTKMVERPQCQPEFIKNTILNYWKGKKQSDEHVRKRFNK